MCRRFFGYCWGPLNLIKYRKICVPALFWLLLRISASHKVSQNTRAADFLQLLGTSAPHKVSQNTCSGAFLAIAGNLCTSQSIAKYVLRRFFGYCWEPLHLTKYRKIRAPALFWLLLGTFAPHRVSQNTCSGAFYKMLSCHEMDPGGLMSSQTISPQHPGKSMDKARNDLTE